MTPNLEGRSGNRAAYFYFGIEWPDAEEGL